MSMQSARAMAAPRLSARLCSRFASEESSASFADAPITPTTSLRWLGLSTTRRDPVRLLNDLIPLQRFDLVCAVAQGAKNILAVLAECRNAIVTRIAA